MVADGMTKQSLGRLAPVDLREVWESEALDFTPWLAQPENMTLLGKAIGIELEVETQEKSVGPFRADILCKDTTTGDWVLIENQLERTDHTHLGQLLTYAAGLEAVTVVWVAGRFTDEHRAALDWLNAITAPTYAFFALEVELWRIDDSPVAPKFNVVSKPNDWSKTLKQAASAAQNYDGMLPLELLLEKCRASEGDIYVGHMGGEADLQQRDLAYLQTKRWKWRDTRTNTGAVVARNWIRCDRFLDIAAAIRATADRHSDQLVP